jgi:CheY-like chemotaxis protein
VKAVHSGPEALDVYGSYRPEIVLLDIGMPGMDGYEVARRIREQDHRRSAALIALTGWGQDEHRQKARQAGFDHHIVKPAEIGSLQTLLAGLRTGLAGSRRETA